MTARRQKTLTWGSEKGLVSGRGCVCELNVCFACDALQNKH